jgi:hypothetical protein
MLKAVTGADKGVRHPYIPANDRVHAFPGSQSRKDVNEYISDRLQFAAKNVAKGLTAKKGVRKEHLLAKGFGDYASAQHTVMDRTSHRDKPKELGVSAPILRSAVKVLSKVIPGIGGQLPSVLEHGTKGRASVDKFTPKSRSMDRAALKDVKDTRQTFESEVHRKLVEDHKMTGAEARLLTQNMYQERIGKAGRTLGNLSRGAEHITTETARVGKALRPLVMGGLHGGGVSGLVNPKSWMGM